MRAKSTYLGRFVRERRFDRNPLRRATDRIETTVLAVLVVAFLAGAPFAAVATGAWFHGVARQVQLSQEVSRFQVQAVVLTVAAPTTTGRMLADQAQVWWRAPDGRQITGEVPVPPGTAVGETTQVWTDRAGDLASPPLRDEQVAEQAVLGKALGVMGAAAVLAMVGALVRWALDKRRIAAWDADWQATGPRWTTRA